MSNPPSLARLASLSGFAAVLLASASPLAAQQVQVGVAASVVGDVRMTNQANPRARQIGHNQRMAWGDLVETRKKSQLHMLLLDRSNFMIGASTQLVIDRFVYDPGKERSMVARVLKGAFRFFSGEPTANASAQIDSPVGTIGIRGTALDGIVGKEAVDIAKAEAAIARNVRHDKKTATLVVLRGPGAATEGGLAVGRAEVTAAGKTVVLDEPGLAAYIPREGAQPIGPFRISPAGLGKLQDELAPSVANAGKGGGVLRTLLPAAAVGVGAALLLGGRGSSDDDRRDQQTGQQSGQSTTSDSTPSTPSTQSTPGTPSNPNNPNNPRPPGQ